MDLSFLGYRLLSPQALRELERRIEEHWRAAYERRRDEELFRIEQLRREAQAMRDASERRCREMESECRRSIREQYDLFDRQWREREGRSKETVQALQDRAERLTESISSHSAKGRKLLALAIDPRTPESESVAAFLKAREQGIRLA